VDKSALRLLGGAAIAGGLLLVLSKRAGASPRTYPPARFLARADFKVDKRGAGPQSLQGFVSPTEVAAMAAGLGNSVGCYDWVVRNITYTFDVGDYWQFPQETVDRRQGDCEDGAFLLASLIRNIEPAYVAIGWFNTPMGSFGHAWVVCRGSIFESTLDVLPADPWGTKEAAVPISYDPGLYLSESEIYCLPGFDKLLTGQVGPSRVTATVEGRSEDKRRALEEFWRGR
jgi:hypothetical protein